MNRMKNKQILSYDRFDLQECIEIIDYKQYIKDIIGSRDNCNVHFEPKLGQLSLYNEWNMKEPSIDLHELEFTIVR